MGCVRCFGSDGETQPLSRSLRRLQNGDTRSGSIVEERDAWPWYQILCLEHTPAHALDPPRPLDASKLPSIHLGDERFER